MHSNDVVAVAGGDSHSLARRHGGTLVAWGFNGSGQTVSPTNSLRFVSIAAGADHNEGERAFVLDLRKYHDVAIGES
jgi:hypothetical protein